MRELSVVIVTYNSAGEIAACLESVAAELRGLNAEVLVVDNASRDETRAIVSEKFPWCMLFANAANVGFPGANNQAIEKATGRLLLLLNPDTVVPLGSIRKMMAAAERDRQAGVLGPMLIDAAGKIAADVRRPTLLLTAMRLVPGYGAKGFVGRHGEVDVLSGAALLVRREVFEAIGLLDERLFWREDVDFCFRAIKAGYRVRKVVDAEILHLEGRSAASNIDVAVEKPIASQIAFFVKHYGKWMAIAETAILGVQTVARLAKWTTIHLRRPSLSSKTKRSALTRVLGRLACFRYVREAVETYGDAARTGESGERRLPTRPPA
jgi:GT2 family glycosyltransferase